MYNSHYEKFEDGTTKCIEDEIPFEIPQNWEWVRMSSYLDVRDGTHDSPKYFTDGVPFVTSKNLCNGKIDFSSCQYISESDHCKFSERSFVEDGDILFAMIGSIGNPVIVNKDREFSIKNVALFKRYSKERTNTAYLFYYLSYIQQELKNIASGGVQSFVGLSTLRSYLIPLPPLAEQQRIVEKLETLLPLVEQYSDAQIKLEKLNSEINGLLKKSILQEAIQGKLVAQCDTDEPAADLLQRIQNEKLNLVKQGQLKKKDISDATIYRADDNKYYEKVGKELICIDDELPFEIPNNWAWVRLGYLFMHNNGKQLNKGNAQGKMMDYITTSNLYWEGFVLDSLKQMPFEDKEIERCQAIKGDLLVCEGGDVGRACIWSYDYPIMLQNHIHKLRAYYPLCTKFFYHVFHLYKLSGIIGGKGIGIKGFSSKALHNTIVPLPPLAEQERIVSKIEELFKVL